MMRPLPWSAGSVEETQDAIVLLNGSTTIGVRMGHLAGAGTATLRVRDASGVIIGEPLTCAGLPTDLTLQVSVVVTTFATVSLQSSLSDASDAATVLAYSAWRSL